MDATLVAGESASDHMVPMTERNRIASQMRDGSPRPDSLHPGGCMISGQVRIYGVLQVALNDSLDCEHSVVESKHRLGWFLLV